MLPAVLSELIRDHRAHHHVFYPPHGNADHGPMTYLALHALGATPADIQRFAAGYRERLAPLPPSGEPLNATNWRQRLGDGDSYGAFLAFFDEQLLHRGWQEVVAEYLPGLLSGMVRGAFHPLIRLAFGIEYQLRSEIGAGLAFLACTGVDERLERASAREPLALPASAHLQSWQAQRSPEFAQGRFDARYERVMEAVALSPATAASGAGFAELSRAALDAFHATHDFFALHLVTGSYAFRVCSPWAGPQPERLLSVALAAAYLVIGAPELQQSEVGPAPLPLAQLATAKDEHDIKIAYSCRALAAADADPTYEWVAARYLAARLR